MLGGLPTSGVAFMKDFEGPSTVYHNYRMPVSFLVEPPLYGIPGPVSPYAMLDSI